MFHSFAALKRKINTNSAKVWSKKCLDGLLPIQQSDGYKLGEPCSQDQTLSKNAHSNTHRKQVSKQLPVPSL